MLEQILSVSLILFAVIDILGSIPLVLDLRERRGRVLSEKATLISLAVMVGFVFFGEAMLSVLGVDVQSFSLVGAFILFLIGCEMVLGITVFKEDVSAKSGPTVFPIAFPVIAGPGTLTTILSLKAMYDQWVIVAGIILNLILVYVVLKTTGWLGRTIGPSGIGLMRKIFGIVLLAIAVKLFKQNLGI